MIQEFKTPERFCPKHGVKMVRKGTENRYSTTTGALSEKLIRFACPKWFCTNIDSAWAVFGGKVAEDLK